MHMPLVKALGAHSNSKAVYQAKCGGCACDRQYGGVGDRERLLHECRRDLKRRDETAEDVEGVDWDVERYVFEAWPDCIHGGTRHAARGTHDVRRTWWWCCMVIAVLSHGYK